MRNLSALGMPGLSHARLKRGATTISPRRLYARHWTMVLATPSYCSALRVGVVRRISWPLLASFFESIYFLNKAQNLGREVRRTKFGDPQSHSLYLTFDGKDDFARLKAPDNPRLERSAASRQTASLSRRAGRAATEMAARRSSVSATIGT
jgi:hypothetical protein